MAPGITGIQHVLQPEVPLIAVSADVVRNSRYVPWTGSLADAARAASSFPGLFTPFNQDGHRLVDGGVVENLPARVLGHTADFVLASNCIPDRLDTSGRIIKRLPGIGRAIDAASSIFLLLGQASRQDAGAADFAFVPTGHTGSPPMSFGQADRTAALGYAQAMSRMGAIKAAYAADLTTHRQS
jgi:predicted acylesterase/phospholipase RssA